MTRDKKTTNGRPATIPVTCRLSFVTGLLFAVGLAVRAQNTPSGFTSVDYYPAPNQLQMKSRLSGAEAQPMPGGILIIKQLRLETFYTNGTLQAVVEAPECIYDTVNNTANSAGHLHLQNGDGTIQTDGDGFLWRQKDSSLTISNHVHSVIATGAEMKTGL